MTTPEPQPSTHRNLADHFASIPRNVGGPIPTPTPADAARRVVRAEYLREKAERIAARAMDDAAWMPGDRLSYRHALQAATAAALAALTERENAR